MPYGDRTGPMGGGPMTGRGAGICAGYGRPGYMNPGFGRGFGGGRGRGYGYGMGGGHGWRHMYYATGRPGWARGYAGPAVPWYPAEAGATVEAGGQGEELSYLKQQAKHFERTLKDIQKRIDELQNEETK